MVEGTVERAVEVTLVDAVSFLVEGSVAVEGPVTVAGSVAVAGSVILIEMLLAGSDAQQVALVSWSSGANTPELQLTSAEQCLADFAEQSVTSIKLADSESEQLGTAADAEPQQLGADGPRADAEPQ